MDLRARPARHGLCQARLDSQSFARQVLAAFGPLGARVRFRPSPQIVTENPIVLFMKGTPQQPMCGFSNRVVMIMNMHGEPDICA